MVKVDQRQVERENRYVVAAVQALLGLIAPSVNAVALEVMSDRLHFRIWVGSSVDEVKEDAEEIIFDMDGLLQPEDMLITCDVLLDDPPADSNANVGRWLYLAKSAAPGS
ncbi:hypothetical protein GCM10023321_17280 [Pseudonocardia eucalypti]|uniref:Uncharacterized protein n=1 Tax=Pseudonocardia eucalypti TaxID=648755 RepID=A0ABP9PRE4_9PSEU|nr:hypothetical protein [Pseudonocardia eucalypti]